MIKTNKKSKKNEELRRLSDEEIKSVNGGMKVDTEDESSWYRTLVDFFFKVNKE